MNENKKQESLTNVIADGRGYKGIPVPYAPARAIWLDDFNSFLDRIEAAYKRDIEKLNSVIQATVSRSDAEIDRLRREVAELRKQIGNEVKLPDGWKMYDKYQIRHTDGTPLKGKQYFVLRLDSDDPSEAARVSAAMSAYKGEAQHGNAAKLREALVKARRVLHCAIIAGILKGDDAYDALNMVTAALAKPPRQCDVGTAEEQEVRFRNYCWNHSSRDKNMECQCPIDVEGKAGCKLEWAQLPYNESEASNADNAQEDD